MGTQIWLQRCPQPAPAAAPTGRHLAPRQEVIRLQGRHLYLWRAVDSEGEILDMLVQSRRDKGAALQLLKKHGFAPRVLVTDKLRSYGAARRELGLSARHEQGMRRTIGLRSHTR